MFEILSGALSKIPSDNCPPQGPMFDYAAIVRSWSVFILNIFAFAKGDGFVKSQKTVMPDLIRHPEHIEITGFRLPPE